MLNPLPIEDNGKVSVDFNGRKESVLFYVSTLGCKLGFPEDFRTFDYIRVGV